MATDAQVAHYQALAAEAVKLFGLDNRPRDAHQQAVMIAGYRRVQAQRATTSAASTQCTDRQAQ